MATQTTARIRAAWREMRALYRDPFRAEMDALSKRAEAEQEAISNEGGPKEAGDRR